MADMVQCPDCASWNPPQTTRCRTCGTELRGPQISFEGPPSDAKRPRSAEEERAAEERRAAAHAEGMKAVREQRREGTRKRQEYQRRKEAAEGEIRAREEKESEPSPGASTEPGQSPEAGSLRTSRLPTNVGGLDEALGGGIPSGFVIVIGGTPGTMKSSLAFWILAHNARAGRRGLYLTCEETTGTLLRQMEALGVNVDGVSEQLKIVDASLLRRTLRGASDWLASLQALVEGVRKEGLDLLVIDSLDGLEALAGFEPRRRELFRLFEWLRDLGVTTFVIGERPDYMVHGTILQPRYDEDFLADGVLNLRLHPISDQDVQRRLRIVKLRATNHETGYLALHVAPGEFEVGRVLGG